MRGMSMSFVLIALALGSCGERQATISQASRSRVLVIYHSQGGNTRHVAAAIAETLGAEVEELRTVQELRIVDWKPVLGGREVTFESRPPIVPLVHDPRTYDLLFLGTPVWLWRPSLVMSSFLERAGLRDRDLALFCTYANRPGGVFDLMRAQLGGNRIVGERSFQRPLVDPASSRDQAAAWARLLVPGRRPSAMRGASP